jgi:hypothetical protein
MIGYNANGVRGNLMKRQERDIFHIVRKILEKIR